MRSILCEIPFSKPLLYSIKLHQHIHITMNVVSHLETQALNYLSFDFLTLLNNFWTWLALTFSRISTPNSELLPPPDNPVLDHPESDPVAVTACVPIPTSLRKCAVDDVKKGKFTLYYEDEFERECETEETTVTEDERDGRGEWWDSWETLLRYRRGENHNSWYTSQDLTALNGSVVKLWDDSFSFGAIEPSRDTTSCVLVW